MLLTAQFASAQVKKQYQDDTFGQTTVVVKEDQATDLEILNSMDLDDYGMDQVIKITTEDIRRMEEKKKAAAAAVAVTEKKTPKKTVILDPTGPERWIPTNKPRKKAKTTAKLAKVEEQEAAPNLGGSYKKSKTVSKSSKKSRVSSSKKTRKYKKSGKRKNRRFKKKKRKRSKRRYSCYQF